VYRLSVPLTASKTADCTIATIHVMRKGDVPADCAASNMIWFEVSISSAELALLGWLATGVVPIVSTSSVAGSHEKMRVVILVLLFHSAGGYCTGMLTGAPDRRAIGLGVFVRTDSSPGWERRYGAPHRLE